MAASSGSFFTLAVAVAMFPLVQITGSIVSVGALMRYGNQNIRCVLLAYLGWMLFLDDSPNRGGYAWAWHSGFTHFLRRRSWWRIACSYYPCTLNRTAALPPAEGPYIFVCHPHGIVGVAPMSNFGTYGTSFDKLFPGVHVHLLGHRVIFRMPFFRDWALIHGHGTVERRCCRMLLSRGDSIGIAPGGAKESLECKPHTLQLYLLKRKGFARLALETGASLVPVLSYGENETYSTVQFKEGTWMRRLQEMLQQAFGIALPLFVGRQWLPLLPKRSNIQTIVGAPLRPKRASIGDKPSEEAVAALHDEYCNALRALHLEHRDKYGYGSVPLELI
mmetsp:Transcript_10374/g.18591  ORF Transcript_10374/g.18591 Transcript_10374/m.18591 type:complete len:333 (-) Transcript_10374:72-1070(-)